MTSVKELNDKMMKVYSKLSPSEKKIAIFLKKHADDIVFYNIVSLSKNLGLSPSGISKFAKILGLNGFKDLQKIYRKNLVINSVEGGFSEKHQVIDASYKNTETKNIIDSVIKHDIHALKTLASTINTKHIDEAVDIIAKANMVYIVGQLRSESIANWLCYTLTMLGKKNYLLDSSSEAMYLNKANFIDEEDVLVAISFQFYSNTVIDLVNKVKDKKGKVVSITDGEFSPLYEISDVCFSMPQENYLFSKSLSTTMSLSLILTTILAQKINRV